MLSFYLYHPNGSDDGTQGSHCLIMTPCMYFSKCNQPAFYVLSILFLNILALLAGTQAIVVFAHIIFNLYCVMMHLQENEILKKLQKTHKIQDASMFTSKFKMAGIFLKRCIDRSNQLKINRDVIF